MAAVRPAPAPVSAPTARSVRVAQRYPARRTFDGVRPTQKVLDILKTEGPMDRDKLWERCKAVGMPSKTYLKHLTRFLHLRKKIIIRPAGPEGTKYQYLLNYLADPVLKKESRPNMPRWRPEVVEEDEELGEVEDAAAREEDEKEARAAQKLQQAALEARAKRQQAAADAAMAQFEKAL